MITKEEGGGRSELKAGSEKDEKPSRSRSRTELCT